MTMTSDSFIFGVDLDGVCANYTNSLAGVIEEDRGLRYGTLPEPLGWDFPDWDLKEGDFIKYHTELVVNRRGFKNMVPIPDVSRCLWELSEAGVWIRIITHRFVLPGNHGLIAADTVEWLDTFNIPYRDICFLGTKADVHADLYVDDAPHNVDALRASGAEVVVFDQPYNQGIAGPRQSNWPDLRDFVLERKEAKC